MIEDLHNCFPCVVICEVGAGEGGKTSINMTKSLNLSNRGPKHVTTTTIVK